MSPSESLKKLWDRIAAIIATVTTLVGFGVLALRSEPLLTVFTIGSLVIVVLAWVCMSVALNKDTQERSKRIAVLGRGRQIPKYSDRQKNFARIGFGLSCVATVGWLVLIIPKFASAEPQLISPAQQGETLLVVAAFDKSNANKGFDAADRIYSLITEKLPPSSGMRVEKYPLVVSDQAQARKVLKDYGAILLIWGWYDDGGAQANVELDKDRIASAKVDFIVATPESFHFKNISAQASYLAFFSLGMMQLNVNLAAATALFTSAIDSAHEAGDAANPWEALMWRGNIYFLSNKLDLAIADYTQSINLYTYKGLYFDRGTAYGLQGKHDLAIADLTKAIVLDPNFVDAYINRGTAYEQEGKHDLAIADANKAIALDPNDKDAYRNRGVAYFSQEKYDLAIADYSKAITLDPNYLSAYNNRGTGYDAQGKYDLAVVDFSKAIALDPNYKKAYSNRGTAYLSQGKYDLAIADYNKAIALDPNSKDAYPYLNRGLAYDQQGKYDLANADYSKAIALDPNDKDAYLNRGLVYDEQRKYDLAIADYNKAIALDPNYTQAYNNRGNSYAGLHKYREAVADYQKSLSLSQAPYTYCVLGITYTKMGDFASAVPALEQGVKLDTANQYPWCKTALENARKGMPTP